MNSTKKEKKFENIVGGKSLNLIPPLTEHEVKVEVRKSSLNMNAALALFVLFLFSLIIVGFNLLSKLELNNYKKELFDMESEVKSKSEVLSSNDEIVRRAVLYRKVEETTYYSKDVIDYWMDVSSNLGKIMNITLSQGMDFEVSGTSNSLGEVSKLWYLLGNDSAIESLNLKNVSRDGDLVRFNFEGRLNFDEFARNARKSES